MQWWMNNTDHACDHIFIHHPEIGVYINPSLTGRGIMDTSQPLTVLWHKPEVDHINVVELKAIEINGCTQCSNKHYSQIRVMYDDMTVIIATSIMWVV